MHPVHQNPSEAFDAVKSKPVSMNTLASYRSQNDASSNDQPLVHGEMGDGSLSGPELSERGKETENALGFGKTVSVANTSVHAVMVRDSQCVRSVASGEGAFSEVVLRKPPGDKAWMPRQKGIFERKDVADSERRNETPRRVEVRENRTLSVTPS